MRFPAHLPLRPDCSTDSRQSRTTERVFRNQDFVSTFLRVYQGGEDRTANVSLKTRILDASGKTVFDKTELLESSQFDAQRSAAIQFRLPLQTLGPGAHLLKVEAGAGKFAVTRDLIFTIKN